MRSISFRCHVLALVCVFCGEQISAQTGTTTPANPGYRTVCYTEGWAHSRHGPLHYDPSDVDTSLCTHVIFQYAVLDPTGLQILPRNQAVDPGLYTQLTALKSTNPELKVMVTLGGYTVSSDEFTKTVSNTSNMRTFAANALSFLNKYNFDGLDLDWEFPGDRGSPPEDKERYVQLLQILQEAFSQNNDRPLILSIVMFPTQYRIGTSYKLPEIANYVDFINLKAFHLHGDWQGTVAHHSALYSSTDDATESIDYLVNFILQSSVPSEKLNLGISFYGIAFNLTDPTNTTVGAPVNGKAEGGDLYGNQGYMLYVEICKLLNEHNDTITTSGRLPGTNAPFVVDGYRWTGYDDVESINEKVDYAIQQGLGGISVWSIDLDDFHGLCGGGEYPLMTAIQGQLRQPLVGR